MRTMVGLDPEHGSDCGACTGIGRSSATGPCRVRTIVGNTPEHGGNVNVRACHVGTMVENTLEHGGM